MHDGRDELDRLRGEMAALKDQFRTVSDIGLGLASRLDPVELLPDILTAARRLTRSEAGTLYVREGDALVFAVTQNDRLEREGHRAADLPSIRLPLDASSLAGLAATERRTLNIEDASKHPSFSKASRARFGYEVVSMLVVPMVDHRGDVLGVLQLLNRQGDAGGPVPYTEGEAYLTSVLASHAASALEIARLHAELNEVFEALVRYTTAAIDARDPCTAGHSARVGAYARLLAEELGGFSRQELREIRIAGIFHDVGKIGVRECVLTKRNRLDDDAMAKVELRFEAAAEAALGEALADGGDARAAAERARARREKLAADLEFLRRAAVPQPLTAEDVERLGRIRDDAYSDWRGRRVPLLVEAEHASLSVRRGNLTEAERREIESHVTHSYHFLRQMPFPKDLARVPELAYSHHEKLDGSGYPRGLKGDEIPLAGRILSVVDVFDALTAEDRPYKRPIPAPRAVEILEHETAAGAWDAEVVAALRRLVASGRLRSRVDDASGSSGSAADDAWT